MFFILSKTVYVFFRPLSLVFILMIIGMIIKNKRLKRPFIVGSFVLLLLFSNDFLANEALLQLEAPPVTIASLEKKYDLGIVLTGITTVNKQPLDRVHFMKGADRIIHAIQLYKLQMIDKILITGGSGKLFKDGIREADQLAEVAVMAGVPQTALIIENNAKNTRENALFTAQIVKNQYPDAHMLLITSAFHMPRAVRCFNKVTLYPDTFGTDYYTHDRVFDPETLFIPSEMAIKKWNIVFHELIGIAAYKVMGYI